jgi:DNA repair protein RecN (Recombination protein N)
MIRELHIKSLALIDDISVQFERGFTVFTGETGAGKSILVGAIGLLLGDRASSEEIRSGAEEAEVQGIFELERIREPLRRLLEEQGISSDDSSCIVRRTRARNGRNRIFINQVAVPLSTLKQFGSHLIDFHGQHEHQSLLYPDTPRVLIDSLANVADTKASYDTAYARFSEAQNALAAHTERAAQLAQRKDLLEFQYNELSSLGLRSDEEEGLTTELTLLSTSSERIACVSEIQALLDSDSASLLRSIGTIRKKLESLARFDASVQPWIADIGAASSVFSELERFSSSYLEKTGAAVDPARLDNINSRLAKIQRLKKKYQCAFDGLLEKQRQLKSDLESLENIDADREVLKQAVAAAEKECLESADKLTKCRTRLSAAFDRRVSALMESLGFKDGGWKTVFSPLPAPSAHGLETIDFLVQTNPGEPFLPLAKIASGGEISRLMLAIKTVFAEQDNIPVLIFDEIDSGIGGILAREVGQALKNLSTTHQVLCISHLHQIAALAHHHFLVYKKQQNKRTVTKVQRLSDEEKVQEIARMLGGESEISKKHAEELLQGR